MVLICFSLINTDIEHLDILTGHSDVFFCNELKSLLPFFIGSVVFIEFQRHLKYYGCRSLSYFANIFFQFIAFSLTYWCFWQQKSSFSIVFPFMFSTQKMSLSPYLEVILFSSNCIVLAFAFRSVILFKWFFIMYDIK